eukprot:s1534_g4.t1
MAGRIGLEIATRVIQGGFCGVITSDEESTFYHLNRLSWGGLDPAPLLIWGPTEGKKVMVPRSKLAWQEPIDLHDKARATNYDNC